MLEYFKLVTIKTVEAGARTKPQEPLFVLNYAVDFVVRQALRYINP